MGRAYQSNAQINNFPTKRRASRPVHSRRLHPSVNAGVGLSARRGPRRGEIPAAPFIPRQANARVGGRLQCHAAFFARSRRRSSAGAVPPHHHTHHRAVTRLKSPLSGHCNPFPERIGHGVDVLPRGDSQASPSNLNDTLSRTRKAATLPSSIWIQARLALPESFAPPTPQRESRVILASYS